MLAQAQPCNLTDGQDGGLNALDILRRYEINVPPRALELLQSGEGETLKPGDPRLPTIETRFVATPQLALEAAANVARSAGYAPYILGDAIEGEARDVVKTMAYTNRPSGIQQVISFKGHR